MRALVLHHDAASTTGLLGDLLADRGVEVHEHWICEQPASPVPAGPLPALDDVAADLVVALGSRWSVYDDETIGAWIHDELDLLRDAHRRDLPVLGICFGGQALAAALGGEVAPGRVPDIGWSTVESDHPDIGAGPWFQWHFDVFTTPPGATELARSSTGPQAFVSGRSLGLQFHPELDVPLLELWIGEDHDQLVDAGVDPGGLLRETAGAAARAHPNTARLLDWFLAGVPTARSAG